MTANSDLNRTQIINADEAIPPLNGVALRNSEVRYRRLFESARDGILILDEQSGKIVDANPFMSELLHCDHEYFMGKQLFEIGFFKDVEQNQAAFRELQAQGYIRYDDLPLETQINTKVDVEFVSNAYEESGKQVIQCNIRDITMKRKAEAALRRGEARYSSLIQAVSQIVWSVDAGGGSSVSEPPWPVYTGMSAEKLQGRLWFNAIHFDDRKGVEHLWGEAVALKKMVEFACRLQRADGQWRHMNVRAIPILNRDGEVREWIGVCIDDTDRYRAEETLRMRNCAIHAVSQGILITDPNQPDDIILYASPGFERITGYPKEEIVGKNCRFLQGKDTDPATVSQLRQCIRAGVECSVEILNYRKDGTPFWNALAISPVRNESGVATHFVGVQSDITERKNLENQLRQAQKMEAVGQLAGGVAHDFNNLLTVISGYSDMLLGTMPPDDPDRESLQAIRDAGERATSLTRQLLAFSRQMVLQPSVLNINKVVKETEKMLRRLIGEDVLLTARTDPQLRQVRVDPALLGQVLMNLAVNARDAMPQGGRLSIETCNCELDIAYCDIHPGARPGQYVQLTMTDSGSGMTETTKRHLFEPFYTTKGVGKGTGLGLAVVYGIVKQSEGYIEVNSEIGVGTSFKIYLPVNDKEVENPPTTVPETLARNGTETVLLVEDDEAVRTLILIALRMRGYTVVVAKNGKEALQLAETHQGVIHLLVTDVVMPEMSGRDLNNTLRLRFPQMKTLFMSGYTDDSVIRSGLVQAKVSFLQKPFSPGTLAIKVRTVLHET